MFLVDWEEPRQIVEPGGERLQHAPVAMWRSLFIANEWTELQVARQANFALYGDDGPGDRGISLFR